MVLSAILSSGGCDRSPSGSTPLAASVPPQAATPQRIIAQGQILPEGGIIKLSATPGDIVSQLGVAVGDQVQAGQTLLTMQSRQVADAKLKTLHKRREDAARQREQAIAAAQQQLSATELKLEQLKAKQAAAQRTAKLLDLAKQLVDASKNVFQKLLDISANPATQGFVGELEIDRQRIQVAQAELDYARQAETQKQTSEELEWSLQAVELERQASSEQLAAADSSQALEILDLEIAAAVEQSATTRLLAPIDGVILAVNVNKGESSLPGPQIEMADLSALVCEIEINEMDAPTVVPGQAATITSRALGEQVLKGQVVQKFKLVGRPQLRSLNPLARADYRTVTAIVKLDAPSTEIAKDWLQLQVVVEIQTSPSTESTTASGPTPVATQAAHETL
ncbi:MAG: efflux RND transporter periplasmic adaptor subunit [Planctomycetales bacterium]|nr:efflux RND transporter periplasmic adaptor subunit [Planctomycetales bacterium]